jgi:carbonic anhydrase/acetyltransferase-like protein (isoleucine patch superfamily)
MTSKRRFRLKPNQLQVGKAGLPPLVHSGDLSLCYYLRKNMIRPFGGIHPQIPESAYVDVSAQVIGDVHIGEQSSVWCNAVLRGDMFYIRIGNRSNIQDNCVVHTRTGSHPTILEDEVTVGHSVTLHGCYVERGALIGIGSIVLDDARVGAQSLVAAGSLISPGTIIPPRSLVMGIPARVKRPLTDEEVAGLNAFWQNYVAYVPKYKSESR